MLTFFNNHVHIASFFLKGSESSLGIAPHLKIDGSSPIRGVGWKTGYLAVSTERKLFVFEGFDPKKIIFSSKKYCFSRIFYFFTN